MDNLIKSQFYYPLRDFEDNLTCILCPYVTCFTSLMLDHLDLYHQKELSEATFDEDLFIRGLSKAHTLQEANPTSSNLENPSTSKGPPQVFQSSSTSSANQAFGMQESLANRSKDAGSSSSYVENPIASSRPSLQGFQSSSTSSANQVFGMQKASANRSQGANLFASNVKNATASSRPSLQGFQSSSTSSANQVFGMQKASAKRSKDASSFAYNVKNATATSRSSLQGFQSSYTTSANQVFGMQRALAIRSQSANSSSSKMSSGCGQPKKVMKSRSLSRTNLLCGTQKENLEAGSGKSKRSFKPPQMATKNKLLKDKKRQTLRVRPQHKSFSCPDQTKIQNFVLNADEPKMTSFKQDLKDLSLYWSTQDHVIQTDMSVMTSFSIPQPSNEVQVYTSPEASLNNFGNQLNRFLEDQIQYVPLDEVTSETALGGSISSLSDLKCFESFDLSENDKQSESEANAALDFIASQQHIASQNFCQDICCVAQDKIEQDVNTSIYETVPSPSPVIGTSEPCKESHLEVLQKNWARLQQNMTSGLLPLRRLDKSNEKNETMKQDDTKRSNSLQTEDVLEVQNIFLELVTSELPSGESGSEIAKSNENEKRLKMIRKDFNASRSPIVLPLQKKSSDELPKGQLTPLKRLLNLSRSYRKEEMNNIVGQKSHYTDRNVKEAKSEELFPSVKSILDADPDLVQETFELEQVVCPTTVSSEIKVDCNDDFHYLAIVSEDNFDCGPDREQVLATEIDAAGDSDHSQEVLLVADCGEVSNFSCDQVEVEDKAEVEDSDSEESRKPSVVQDKEDLETEFVNSGLSLENIENNDDTSNNMTEAKFDKNESESMLATDSCLDDKGEETTVSDFDPTSEKNDPKILERCDINQFSKFPANLINETKAMVVNFSFGQDDPNTSFSLTEEIEIVDLVDVSNGEEEKAKSDEVSEKIDLNLRMEKHDSEPTPSVICSKTDQIEVVYLDESEDESEKIDSSIRRPKEKHESEIVPSTSPAPSTNKIRFINFIRNEEKLESCSSTNETEKMDLNLSSRRRGEKQHPKTTPVLHRNITKRKIELVDLDSSVDDEEDPLKIEVTSPMGNWTPYSRRKESLKFGFFAGSSPIYYDEGIYIMDPIMKEYHCELCGYYNSSKTLIYKHIERFHPKGSTSDSANDQNSQDDPLIINEPSTSFSSDTLNDKNFNPRMQTKTDLKMNPKKKATTGQVSTLDETSYHKHRATNTKNECLPRDEIGLVSLPKKRGKYDEKAFHAKVETGLNPYPKKRARSDEQAFHAKVEPGLNPYPKKRARSDEPTSRVKVEVTPPTRYARGRSKSEASKSQDSFEAPTQRRSSLRIANQRKL